MYFDRFDICEAWYLYASRYHEGQWSKLYSVLSRLIHMKFTPPMDLNYHSLTDNGKAIYRKLVKTKKY